MKSFWLYKFLLVFLQARWWRKSLNLSIGAFMKSLVVMYLFLLSINVAVSWIQYDWVNFKPFCAFQ